MTAREQVAGFWSRLSSEDRGSLGIMAGFGLPLTGICLARGGGFDGLGDLLGTAADAGPMVGGVTLAGLLVVGALRMRGGASASLGREIVVHHDAGEYGIAARHEAGHIVMAEQVGCRVTGAQNFSDGSGWTSFMLPFGGLGPIEDGAIDVAGEVASGTSSGCGGDQRQFRNVLRGVGWSNRSYVKRKSYSLARAYVGPRLLGNGQVARYERRLLARGRL